MKILGAVTKKDKNLDKTSQLFSGNEWVNKEIEFSSIKVHLFYKKENIKVVSTENELFISHDNIFINKENKIISPDDAKILELLSSKKERVLEGRFQVTAR